ncbi:MAG: UbiD family decarboxylase [Gemmataceae bacterium]|nr:UbiD family decarboxylase [Gemmataceae bacterium]
MRSCLRDLERTGQLVRIEEEVDPHLEAAAIHRRVQRHGGPALWFRRVRGTSFTMVSNLYGTSERIRFLFRDTLEAVRQLMTLKRDPEQLIRRPWQYWRLPALLRCALPRWVQRGAVLAGRTTLSQLPQVQCWPGDGGPFITLPQVYTEDPEQPGWRHSNLGMYRVQIAGNDYVPDRECGLHYQIHRGIGVHHAAALRRGQPLPVCISVGGPPALAVAAVMPLPEGMPEVAFAGILAGRRLRLCSAPASEQFPLPLPADAEFVITGYVYPWETKPEGPFGDHLGYYSLRHGFPVLRVSAVYHRRDAIWPFTVVGRPPQEDSCFGELIHELTGPVIPSVLPGVRAVHAVDAAGVHPLLLAIGSERYVPYAAERQPQELLTQAHALLGQGQLSLAKYLLIVAQEDDPSLDVHDIAAFFQHVLERLQPDRDLHFQTRTTIDTLDYSAGCGLNAGSKLVIAVAGKKRRQLAQEVPFHWPMPPGFGPMRMVLPGIVALQGPRCRRPAATVAEETVPADADLQTLLKYWDTVLAKSPEQHEGWPLVTVVDDADFVARHLDNWLWVVFTRSDPAQDVHGVGAFIHNKHWGCRGPLIIDARLKPFMPDPLDEDPAMQKRIDRFFTRGGPLARWG